jgi:hypothetical protein
VSHGGPILYLTGNLLFKGSLVGHVPASRLAGVGVLVLLIPFAAILNSLALATAAAGVMAVLAAIMGSGAERPAALPFRLLLDERQHLEHRQVHRDDDHADHRADADHHQGFDDRRQRRPPGHGLRNRF